MLLLLVVAVVVVEEEEEVVVVVVVVVVLVVVVVALSPTQTLDRHNNAHTSPHSLHTKNSSSDSGNPTRNSTGMVYVCY